MGLTATGCIYRMGIRQGNFIAADDVAKLENGMTRSQVAFLLGTPMIPSAFDKDRWDYMYYLKDLRRGAADTRRVTVWFEDDKVARVEKGPDTGAAPHIGMRNQF
jgi:outer membrane protein assembly factor BamE